MALLRADIETTLVSRAGDWLAKAGMAVTTAGSNADLTDAIAWGVRQAGYTLASDSDVTDSDLSSVASTATDRLIDLAELRMLRTIYQNYVKVDVAAPAAGAKLDQLRQAMRQAIADKKAQIAADYAIGGYAAFSVQLGRNDGYTTLADDLA
jgi:hypothetical protein